MVGTEVVINKFINSLIYKTSNTPYFHYGIPTVPIIRFSPSSTKKEQVRISELFSDNTNKAETYLFGNLQPAKPNV